VTALPKRILLRLRSDDRLAAEAARGDRAAFAALYERHHGTLYRYCRSIAGDPDDAADALQSTMASALAAIAARDAAAPVRAWLFRIAHNESISLVRRRRVAAPLDADALVGSDVEADAERRRALAQLVADLGELSDRQRGALMMRELSGLGHAEIAAALATSEGAVKQAIFEARSALHDFAAGREMACESVQRRLSDGDGRTARSRHVRGHLRECAACREFRDELRARRSELAAIAPAATAAAGTTLFGGAAKSIAVGAAAVTVGGGAVAVVLPEPVRHAVRAERPAEASAAPRRPVGDEPRRAVAAETPVPTRRSGDDDRGSGPGSSGDEDRGASGDEDRGALRGNEDRGSPSESRRESPDDDAPEGEPDDEGRDDEVEEPDDEVEPADDEVEPADDELDAPDEPDHDGADEIRVTSGPSENGGPAERDD
jgi:RNA polymerase sigma factor (sigma-70 family)